MKVLILEDNLSLAESLKHLLSQQGFETRIKSCWETAVPLLKFDFFDIIVLDILLPDKKGFEVLKILSEKNIKSKIALISGLFNEATVSENIPEKLKKNCLFFKKPIDEQAFLKFIKKEKSSFGPKGVSFMESLFSANTPSKPLSFYFPSTKDRDSKELISIVFTAHLKQWTGELEVAINNNINSIQFFKGRIIKVVSNSGKSFLGELLVEHGLSLQEDIELLLEQKDTNKKMGELLVEKELLSPYMLHFILKEQMKIRLSEFMSHSVLRLTVKEKKPKDFMSQAEVDFNALDFIEWLADSVQTELSEKFLNKFYLQIQNSLVYKTSQLNMISISQKKFLTKYNKFFKSLKEGVSVEELMKEFKNSLSALALFYFGLLTKSIYLKQGNSVYLEDKALEKFLDDFLSKKFENAFQVFGLLEQADISELDEKYREMVQKLHPDALSKNINPVIKEKAERALLIVTEKYDKIKNEDKKKEYIAEKHKDQFLTVIDQYEAALLKIKEEDYKTANSILLKIEDHKQAPSNTVLYLLWTRMKQQNIDIGSDRTEAIKIQKIIDSCPISLRTSSLFWFVKGLFYLNTKRYEKAKELFTKTLVVQKDFAPAKKELIAVKHKLSKLNKQGKSKSLFSFFKKSS